MLVYWYWEVTGIIQKVVGILYRYCSHVRRALVDLMN